MATIRFAMLAMLWHMYGCMATNGNAEFKESVLAVSETMGVIAIPIFRTGGSTGALTATVTASMASGNASVQDFQLETPTMAWSDGDNSYKAVFLRLVDDDLSEGLRILVLHLEDSNLQRPASAISTLEVHISHDTDGGVVHFVKHGTSNSNAANATFFGEEIMDVLEGAEGCLVSAKRSGTAGFAAVQMQPGACPLADLEAKVSKDFDFAPAAEPLSWAPGEGDERCLLRLGEAQNPQEGSIRLWRDGIRETPELICLQANATGSAQLDRTSMTLLLRDRATDSGGSTNCTFGRPCNIQLQAGLNLRHRLVVGYWSCGPWTCLEQPPIEPQDGEVKLGRDQLHTPGLWLLCACASPPQVVHEVHVAGPYYYEDVHKLDTSEFFLSIDGLGLQAGAHVTIRWDCDDPFFAEDPWARTTDGITFRSFHGKLLPGRWQICWCGSDNCFGGLAGDAVWTYIGIIDFHCKAGFVAREDGCETCFFPWDYPNEMQTSCLVHSGRATSYIVFVTCFMLFCFISFGQLELKRNYFELKPNSYLPYFTLTGRNVRIEDLDKAPADDHIVVTTLGPHRFRHRSSFTITIEGTLHPDIDSKQVRAEPIDHTRLKVFMEDTKAAASSSGYFYLSIWETLWFSHSTHIAVVRVPILLLVLMVVQSTAAFFVWQEIYNETELALALSIPMLMALTLRAYFGVIKWRRPSPLKLRLQQFSATLKPHPKTCERGPKRAIQAQMVVRLCKHFSSFLGLRRSMYYVCSHLVVPICKKFQVSFAERVGPQEADFFVSHFWGTPFHDFCESLHHHAVRISDNDKERSWTTISYWICTFSNNQFKVQEELGEDQDYKNSSFYMALEHGQCKGTVMMLDKDVRMLTRSWCLFELLETIKLEKSKSGFEGAFFATPAGVLNFGDATVEVVMQIAEATAKIRLQDARATVEEDKRMIDEYVLQEMGSYESINYALKQRLAEALVKCQNAVNRRFTKLAHKLEQSEENLNQMVQMDHIPTEAGVVRGISSTLDFHDVHADIALRVLDYTET
ncbi:unnamed protein product [Effrenium voratum]|uniref:Uncharacterized protein n=1 Tax=Effrenium voratum TaxID=2562239 RepID=A0AA36HZP3_9DINO|nr:unnamed protein product [Effrenium voratum]CAJ1413636.1 unnamed protein product [Effrenium voratum]